MYREKIKLSDKVVSALTYVSCGWVGVAWLLYCAITKKTVSKFILFNVYQAICFALFMYFAYLLFILIHDMLIMIPYVNILVNALRIAILSPVFYGWSSVGLVIFVIYAYMMLMSLLGKIAYIPFISNIILYQLDRFNGGK